jgi:predicted permease
MRTLWQDLCYGFRLLMRYPGFNAFVVAILAVGIGATAAMLSIADAVLLRPCPYQDPDTLVCVCPTDDGVEAPFTSLADFQDWRRQNDVFQQLVGANQWNGFVRTADRTENCRGHLVSPEFFSALGVPPLLGRTFLPEEHRRGGERVVMLSYDHWHHWFAGDPNVIGRTLRLDGQVYTVVGVLPEGFRWVFQRIACGLWLPLPLDTVDTNRDHRGLQAMARLKAGITLAQAQAQMDLIAQRLAQAYPDTNARRGIRLVPINAEYARWAAGAGKPRILMAAAGVVLCVLLIACLHVASLQIARAATREREIVVRAALGAHRLRLVRQLLMENVLLAALGGLCGIVLAYWALGILSALRGRSIPWSLGPGMDRVIPWFLDVRMGAGSLAYVLMISLLTCVAFGLLPALSLSKTRLHEALSAGRAPLQVPRSHRLRAVLVVLDIAVAFVLVLGAGLMVNSYGHILKIDLRVNTKNVLVTGIDLGPSGDRYAQTPQCMAYARRIMESIRRLPGVQLVALANGTPAWRGYNASRFLLEGLPASEDRAEIRWTPVSTDYFRLLQIPLRQGRLFAESDDHGSLPVAIINESLAQRLWPNQNPLGRHLTHGDPKKPVTREIVGIVGDRKHLGGFPDDEVYLPCWQVDGFAYSDVMVRTGGRAGDLATAIRREILAVEPDAIVDEVALLDRRIADLFSAEWSYTLLLSVFAAVALLLAGIGVYGTIAYTVSQRTHEFGIRMALGARKGDVLKAVLRQGLTLTFFGLVLGVGGALAATQVLRHLLYEISPTDPLTFVCVWLLLTGVVLLASYVPARRAARIDPMTALRWE